MDQLTNMFNPNDFEIAKHVYTLTPKQYHLLNREELNRRLTDGHVNKLMGNTQSITIDNPVVLNRDMSERDGNHRIEAAIRENKNIYFIIADNVYPSVIEGIAAHNIVQKKWSLDTFLNAYVKAGYKEYIKFKATCAKLKIKPSIGFKILGKNRLEFSKGQFILTLQDFKKLEYVVALYNAYSGVCPVRNKSFLYEGCRAFYNHFSKIVTYDAVCTKLQTAKLKTCDEGRGYFLSILDAYNKHKRGGDRLTLN